MQSSRVQWLVRRPSAIIEPDLDRMSEFQSPRLTIELGLQYSPFSYNHIEKELDGNFTIELPF
jgi:hypothetical protein